VMVWYAQESESWMARVADPKFSRVVSEQEFAAFVMENAARIDPIEEDVDGFSSLQFVDRESGLLLALAVCRKATKEAVYLLRKNVTPQDDN